MEGKERRREEGQTLSFHSDLLCAKLGIMCWRDGEEKDKVLFLNSLVGEMLTQTVTSMEWERCSK